MNDTTAWLQSLGLGEHASAFVAQGIEFELLPELGDADLKELGVTLLGHRKRLLIAIAALNAPSVAPSPPPPPGTRDAERRQLTVMFCDLVGSTQLAARLDPEDLQGLIATYHDAVSVAVAPYDGHVAQLLGDGCLVYFGYPHAHENDAERAVRAALNVLKAVAGLRPMGEATLQTRIGIATGRVVVGEIGAGTAAAERTASGETPNLAARLQAQAAPGEIVLSAETRHLAGSAFDLESTGKLDLKGFAAPVEAFRVRGERSVASRFEAQHDESELIEFVGRASEVALLLERWNLACDGEGQVVLLTGEAGIGKSRITQTLRERLAAERHATVLLQCSPYHSGSALYPVVQYFERTTGMTPADTPAQRGEKLLRLTDASMGLAPQSLGHLLRLMGATAGDRLPAPAEDPQQDKMQMLQAPIDLLRALARQLPVLLLIEDAHWIDPTTEQLGAMTIEQSRDSRLLVLVTARPEYKAPWGSPANLTRLALNRLGQRQCAELVSAVTNGRTLPPEVLAEIIAKTDGIPLFVEELTKTVMQSGLLEEGPEGYRLRGPLPALAIPSTLQDSLMARLDRLAPAKEVAQVGAMIGREFSHSLLAAVLRMPAPKLAEALDELVRSELVARRGAAADARYTFRHALIRDTAYHSMLKGQRVLRHGQISAAIEQLEPDTKANHPELLAYHCQEGGQTAEAFRYWSAAGERAIARAANREAVSHFRAALALLPTLGLQGPALAGAELQLQMHFGTVLMQTEGYASAPTMAAFGRARELALQLDQVDHYALACSAHAASLWAAGRFDEELALLDQFGPDERARLRPMSRVFLAVVSGLVKFHLGALEEVDALSRNTLRELAAIPPSERQDIGGVDPMVMVLTQCIGVCVHRGLLDQADAHTRTLTQIAQARDHVPTRTWAQSLERWMAFRHGDYAESIRLSRELIALAEQLGFRTRLSSGLLLLGRGIVASGQVDEGLKMLNEGYALWSADSSRTGASELAAVAADVLLEAGRLTDAETFVRAGEAAQAEVPERFFAAELLRLRARLSQAAGDVDAAEQGFRSAIAVAEGQSAALFALHAATDLAQLLLNEGRAAEGLTVLQSALDAMPEGRDQRDALRATAALQALAQAVRKPA